MPSLSTHLSCAILFVTLAGCNFHTVRTPPSAELPTATAADPAASDVLEAQAAESSPPAAAVATRPLAASSHLSTYTVCEGETLWLIAARNEIYADPLLWPLLYKANRDQIKDPAHIFPGQQLSIPRNLDHVDLENARESARKSDLFPTRTGAFAPPR